MPNSTLSRCGKTPENPVLSCAQFSCVSETSLAGRDGDADYVLSSGNIWDCHNDSAISASGPVDSSRRSPQSIFR